MLIQTYKGGFRDQPAPDVPVSTPDSNSSRHCESGAPGWSGRQAEEVYTVLTDGFLHDTISVLARWAKTLKTSVIFFSDLSFYIRSNVKG
jgi:hypothetical protein